jgi:acyl-coenzyme A thioesterase PaaI-like protein
MKVTDPNILTQLIHERLPDNWGERVVRIDDHAIQVSLPWNDRFAGAETWGGSTRPVVSGPVIMGIADTAMYGCCLAAAGPDAVPVIVTVTTTFLSPFATRGIDAVATIVRSGRRISHLRCELAHDCNTTPLATCHATYAIQRSPRL